MIELSNDKIKLGIKLPTDVDEITAEMLEQLTAQVKLGKGYAIIALCYEVNFMNLIFTKKQQKATRVYTKVAKLNGDSDFIDVKVGDVIAISQSSIEMGQHIHINSVASEKCILAYLLDKARLTKPSATAVTPADLEDIDSRNFLLMEFKVIPIRDIRAAFDYSVKLVDPFEIK